MRTGRRLGGEVQREEPSRGAPGGGAWGGQEGGTDWRGWGEREGREEELHEGRCQGTREEPPEDAHRGDDSRNYYIITFLSQLIENI